MFLLLDLFGTRQSVGMWSALFISAAFVVVIVWRLGVLSVLSIVVLVTTLYGAAPAYDIFNDLGVSFIDRSLYIDTFLPILMLYLSALAFGFWQVRVSTIRSLVLAPNGRPDSFKDVDGLYGYFLLLALASAYFLASVERYGLLRSDFSRAEIYQGNNLGLQIIRCGIIYGAMYGFIGLQNSTKYFRDVWRKGLIWLLALSLYLYVDLIIFGDRRMFLSAALAILVAAKPKSSTLAWMVVVGVPTLGFLWLLSYLRGLPIHTWLYALEKISWDQVFGFASGEFSGWTRIAGDVLGASFAEVQQLSVLKAPLSLIPSWIYPDRPLAPSLWYVQTFDPQTAAIGGGWGFALPVEAYINGWYLGPVLFGLGIGAVIGSMDVRSGMPQMLAIFVFCFSFRMDLVSLLQQGLLTAAFAFVYHRSRRIAMPR